MVEGNNGKGSW